MFGCQLIIHQIEPTISSVYVGMTCFVQLSVCILVFKICIWERFTYLYSPLC